MPSALFPAFARALRRRRRARSGTSTPRRTPGRSPRRSSPAGCATCAGRASASASPRRSGASRSSLFGLADSLWLALVLLAFAGAADFVSAVLRSTILLTATPDAMRGRLSGIELAQVASAPSLGNLEAGVVASLDEPALLDRLRRRLCVAGTLLLALALPGAPPLRRAPPGAGVTLTRELLRAPRARGRARADRRDAARRRRRRPDRRGRGLRPRGSGEPRLPRPRTARNAVDVRPARPRVRLPLVRHPLVPEPRLRRRGRGARRCSSARSSRRAGLDAMRARRGLDDARLLCAGPGRLCQALGVTREHDGLRARRAAVRAARRATATRRSSTGPRIGITRGAELPWRYGLAGSRFLSRPLRPA